MILQPRIYFLINFKHEKPFYINVQKNWWLFTLFLLVLTPSSLQVFDWKEERPRAEGQSDEGRNQVKERRRFHSDEWVTVSASQIREVDVEPLDYDLDISREVDAHMWSICLIH